jgi:hypothetical protein
MLDPSGSFQPVHRLCTEARPGRRRPGLAGAGKAKCGTTATTIYTPFNNGESPGNRDLDHRVEGLAFVDYEQGNVIERVVWYQADLRARCRDTVNQARELRETAVQLRSDQVRLRLGDVGATSRRAR